jgi:hypothetical protein
VLADAFVCVCGGLHIRTGRFLAVLAQERLALAPCTQRNSAVREATGACPPLAGERCPWARTAAGSGTQRVFPSVLLLFACTQQECA